MDSRSCLQGQRPPWVGQAERGGEGRPPPFGSGFPGVGAACEGPVILSPPLSCFFQYEGAWERRKKRTPGPPLMSGVLG
jgi:hypothetical protein